MSKETIEVLTGEPLEVHLQSEQTLDVVDSGAEQHFIESEQVLEIYLDSPISLYPTGGSGNGYMSDQSPDTTQYSGFGAKRGFTHVQLSWIEINVPKHHKHTRVLRSKQNDLSTAEIVGDTESTVFTDNIAPDATYYYWLQGVTYTGNTTDYSEVITVSVSADQQKILEYLGLNNVLSELNRIEDLIYSSGGAIGLQLEELAAQNLSEALELINDSIITVNENMFSIEQRLGLASDEAFAVLTQQLTALVDDNNARITQINTLTAQIENETGLRQAEVSRLDQAFANQDSAIATTRTELEALIETEASKLAANILSEKEAAVTREEALARSIDSLSTTVTDGLNQVNADIEQERISRSNSESALASQITDLESSFQTTEAELNARINQELTTLTTANSALAQEVTDLRTSIDTEFAIISADVSEQLRAFSDENGSFAESLLNLEANYTGLNDAVSNVNAALNQESITRANENEALAQQSNALRTEFETYKSETDARIETIETTQSGPDGSLAQRVETLEADYTSLEGDISTNSARITSEETARANADQSLSNRITTLRSDMETDIGTAVAEAEQYTLSVVGYCTIDGSISDDTTKASCEANGGVWSQLPLSQALDKVSVTVTKPDGTVTTGSVGTQFTAFADDLGNIKTRAFLGTDVNGRVTGLVVTDEQGNESSNKIQLVGSQVEILNDETGVPFVSYDTVNKRGVIRGQLILDDGTSVSSEDDIRARDGDTIYVEYEYSETGISAWHSPMAENDVYRRERTVTNGVPGEWSSAVRIAGFDAPPKYNWIKYSPNADGSNLTDIPDENTKYIGISYNNDSPTESTNPADYMWTKFVGDTPVKGEDYFDGKDGNFISFIYKVTDGNAPAIPTGGSFDGTNEVFPTGWSDDPIYEKDKITWVSKRTYSQGSNGSWSGSPWSTPTKWYEKGEKGDAPTITTNPDGSYTISNGVDSVTVKDGDNAPIPTVTNNNNGTYTIEDGSGNSITVKDGDTPIKGVDYFDGVNGDYVSFIYRSNPVKPATPTGGSFDGTTESLPGIWSDTPTEYTAPEKRWVSSKRYRHNGTSWVAVGNWSEPVVHAEKGDKGDTPTFTTNPDGSYTISNGTDSITVKDGDNAPIPTVTDNGNGTYTINDGSGNTITVSDGYTPQKGIDYFDGLNGDFVSYVYRTSSSKPTKPSGGSFNGTSEVVPSSWSDTPTSYASPNKRWVSTRRYRHNGSSWSAVSDWSDPVVHAERGQAATQYYTWVKYAKLFYSWTGSRSWEMETTIANAVVWTFDAPVAGKVRIGIKANDAEGGSRMAVDGTLIGTMAGPDNATRWYYFETTVTAGSHDIQIWSTAADGGSVLAIEVIGSMSDSGVDTSHIGFAYQKTSSTESTSFLDYQWSESKGKPGPGFYTITNSSGSFPSNDQATIDFVNNFIKAPEVNDHLTYVNAAKTNSTTKRFNGSSWIEPTLVVNGDALVKGTVTTDALAAKAVSAEKIDVDDLFAQDITATGMISGLNLTGARVEARDSSTGKYALLDSGTGSPIIVNDGTRDVLRFDSNNRLVLDAGLGENTITSPSVFSKEIWDQIKLPLTEGSTGGSFSAPDVVKSYNPKTNTSTLSQSVIIDSANTSPVTTTFNFVDYATNVTQAEAAHWKLTLKAETRSSASAAWSSPTVIDQKNYFGEIRGYRVGVTEVGYSFTGNISGATVGGQIRMTITLDLHYGLAENPKLTSVSAFQRVQGGGVAGEATLLNGKEGSYYLNYENFTGNISTPNDIKITGQNKGLLFKPDGVTDYGGIRFTNTNNNDGAMEFWTSDDWTEPFRWRSYDAGLGTSYREWMTLDNDKLSVMNKVQLRNSSGGDGSGYYIGRRNGTGGTEIHSLTDIYIYADQNSASDSSQYVRMKSSTAGKEFQVRKDETYFTGHHKTTGSVYSGLGSGGVALTINDGQGNANVTFNHAYGVPEQDGNAARIEVNTDGTTNAGFSFEVGSGVTGGQSVGLTQVLWLSASEFQYKGNNVYHTGNKPSKSDVGLSLVANRAFNWQWGSGTPTHIWASPGNSTTQYVYTPNNIRDAMDIRWSDIQNKPRVATVQYGVSRSELHNSATLDSGFYTISQGLPNADNSGTEESSWWHVLNFKHGDDNGYGAQLALELSSGTDAQLQFRTSQGSGNGHSWTGWYKVYSEQHKPTWGEVTGKPSQFTPASHTHSFREVNFGGSFNINGSGAGAQENGVYATSVTDRGTTDNPTYTVVLSAQNSASRSIHLSVDGDGYLWGMRSHSNAGTYKFQSKVKNSDQLGGVAASSYALKPNDHTSNNSEYHLVWENRGGDLYTSGAHLMYNPALRRITTGAIRLDGNDTIETASGDLRLNPDGMVNINGGVRIGNSANNILQVTNTSGWVRVGANNTGWAHFYTDRGKFYMDSELHVDGAIKVYNKMSQFTADGNHALIGSTSSYFVRITNNGDIARKNSGWTNNSGEQKIIRNAYVGNVGDYLQLQPSGNRATNGTLMVGTNGFAVGLHDLGGVEADVRVPFNDTWMSVNTTDFWLSGKRVIRHSDSWLRLNEDKSFSSGIYCGGSTLRTDGNLQVGSSGNAFNANTGQIDLKVTTRVHGRMHVKEIVSQDGNFTTIGTGELGSSLYSHVTSTHGAGNEGVHIGGEHGVYLYSHPNNMTGGMAASYSVRVLASDGASYLNHLDVYKTQNNASQIVARFRHPNQNTNVAIVAKNQDKGSFRLEANADGGDLRIQTANTAGNYSTANGDTGTIAQFYRNGDVSAKKLIVDKGNSEAQLDLKSNGDNCRIFWRGGDDNFGFFINNSTRLRWTGSNNRWTATGEIWATDHVATSDRRVKDNLDSIDNALDKIDEIEGFTYDHLTLNGRKAGVIAQDIQKVLPEAVSEDDNGILSVSPLAVIGLLVNAVKELKEQVRGLLTWSTKFTQPS